MEKRTAHIILTLFDVAAFAALIWLIRTLIGVRTELNSADSIEYFNGLPWLLLLMMMPIIHGIALFELFKPLTARMRALFNKVILAGLVIFAGLALYINNVTINLIESKNFEYCKARSEPIKFAEIKVFVKDSSQCIEL